MQSKLREGGVADNIAGECNAAAITVVGGCG